MVLPIPGSNPSQQKIQHERKNAFPNQKPKKHWRQHVKSTAPQHLLAYLPTSHQYLAIFYHLITLWITKLTLIQEIKYGSFSTWTGIT